jgi:hypothetical protein
VREEQQGEAKRALRKRLREEGGMSSERMVERS